MGQRGLWTGKRLRDISRELAQLGLRVCPNTVRRLLEELDYALHANRKSLSTNISPHRDQQFGWLNHYRQEFTQSGYPIISVDTKKKELVGQFKNSGRVWSQAPNLCRTMISAPKLKVWLFPMGFTTSRPIVGWWWWAPLMIPRSLPWMPFATGGAGTALGSTPMLRNCSF